MRGSKEALVHSFMPHGARNRVKKTLTYSCMVWIDELTLIEKIQLHLCALHEGVVSHRLLSTWWLVEVFRRDPHRVSPSSLSMTSMRTIVSRDCIFILVVFRIDPHGVFPSSLSMTSMRAMVSRDCIFTLVELRIDPHRVFPSPLSMTSMRTMVLRDCIFILVFFEHFLGLL